MLLKVFGRALSKARKRRPVRSLEALVGDRGGALQGIEVLGLVIILLVILGIAGFLLRDQIPAIIGNVLDTLTGFFNI